MSTLASENIMKHPASVSQWLSVEGEEGKLGKRVTERKKWNFIYFYTYQHFESKAYVITHN